MLRLVMRDGEMSEGDTHLDLVRAMPVVVAASAEVCAWASPA